MALCEHAAGTLLTGPELLRAGYDLRQKVRVPLLLAHDLVVEDTEAPGAFMK